MGLEYAISCLMLRGCEQSQVHFSAGCRSSQYLGTNSIVIRSKHGIGSE